MYTFCNGRLTALRDINVVARIHRNTLRSQHGIFRVFRTREEFVLLVGKVENVNSDFATFVRTIVILCALGAILAGTGQWQSPGTVSVRSYTFLVLSGLATGGSWVCYFRALKLGDAARVAPIDKMSVVLVLLLLPSLFLIILGPSVQRVCHQLSPNNRLCG